MSNDEKLSSNKDMSKNVQMKNFLAGGFAGSIASTLTIPLEVIKTQLQSSRISGKTSALQVARRIFVDEGLKGFFKGWLPLIIGIMPTRALYFGAYTTSKDTLRNFIGDSPSNHLVSAFIAGATSSTITNPWWMVRTRFQIIADSSVGQKKYKYYREVVSSIWKEDGIKGFYKGLSASYVGCFEGAIYWILYEKCKSYIINDLNSKKFLSNENSNSTINHSRSSTSNNTSFNTTPSPIQYFLAAAVSKFMAICITYPHEVVRTRLREQATNGVFKYSGFFTTLKITAKEEGMRGLYGGMGTHLMRSVPNAAILFLSFELMSTWLQSQTA